MHHFATKMPVPAGFLAAVSALALSATGASAANFLLNGSFEPGGGIGSSIGSQGPLTADVDGWETLNFDYMEIHGSAVDFGVSAFTNTDPADTIPDDNGVQYLELNSNGYETLWQDVTIPTEELVQFSFAHRPKYGPDAVTAKVIYAGVDGLFGTGDDATTSLTATSSDPGAWTFHEAPVFLSTAGGKYRVSFSTLYVADPDFSDPYGSEGNYLDSVYLGPVIVPVPEPSAIGLAGLAGTAALLRRRRK